MDKEVSVVIGEEREGEESMDKVVRVVIGEEKRGKERRVWIKR